MNDHKAITILKQQRHYFTNRGVFEVEEKSRANYVTSIDKEIEDNIKQALANAYPSIAFVGEEEVSNAHFDTYWLLDPIDGTQNFIKRQYPSMISLALVSKGRVTFAVIYDPYFDDVYHAELGRGAFLNGLPIHVSDSPLNKAIIMVGTSPYSRQLSHATFQLAHTLFDHASDIRRSGSACYDLVQVACGRADAYVELFVHSWDYAAGYLLVKEAGGQVSDIKGQSLDDMKIGTTTIVASNQHLHHQLIHLTKESLS